MGAQGHRTTAIPHAFWEASGVFTTPNFNQKRLFPILITFNPSHGARIDSFELLVRLNTHYTTPLACRQLSVLEDKATWTRQEAQTQLVNEASLALRPLISNKNNLHNPMKLWNDAVWFFRWMEDHLGMHHCVLLACIPVPAKDLVLQRPGDYEWQTIHPRIQNFLGTHDLGQLIEINEGMEFMIQQMVGDDLMALDPSPARPGHKKGRPGSRARSLGHPLGGSTVAYDGQSPAPRLVAAE